MHLPHTERPFNPHAIARLRPGAYQKSIFMKYIDNLLDWGQPIQSVHDGVGERGNDALRHGGGHPGPGRPNWSVRRNQRKWKTYNDIAPLLRLQAQRESTADFLIEELRRYSYPHSDVLIEKPVHIHGFGMSGWRRRQTH